MPERPAEAPHGIDGMDMFSKLEPFMATVAAGNMNRDGLFVLCVKASVTKCFEFNVFARRDDEMVGSFFAISTLRSICEDLIVLNYLNAMSHTDRERLLERLMSHELYSRLKLQDLFFTAMRPQQPVLRVANAESELAAIEAAIHAIWNRNGWPNLKTGTMPQVRQVAEKQSLSHLLILYDYLYRLTSGGVHFSVQALLRSGWGPNPAAFHFSTSHFRSYFSAYCRLYGAFMFCVYFEFFGEILSAPAAEVAVVEDIRKWVLREPRWPEMVTFEEMNQAPPKDSPVLRVLMSLVQAESTQRLIE